jgi:hypothetical protein
MPLYNGIWHLNMPFIIWANQGFPGFWERLVCPRFHGCLYNSYHLDRRKEMGTKGRSRFCRAERKHSYVFGRTK